jgi:mannose-6-phosphate isomerase-like protein (cupin superfamily)
MPEVSEDFAGEFVLGALDADERSAVERRIRTEPDFRRAVDAWSHRLMPLLERMSPVIPPASTWAAIQRSIGSAAPSAARRRADGVWLDVAPGTKLKMLHVDPVTGERTALMRMEPGCVYPEHDHPQVEECFVLEGAVTIDGRIMAPAIIPSRRPAPVTAPSSPPPAGSFCFIGTLRLRWARALGADHGLYRQP